MNGRISLSAKAIGPGRTGVSDPIAHGVQIPGIDLAGLEFLAGIRIVNLATGANQTSLNLSNLEVTPHGATVTDDSVDFRGSSVSVAQVKLLVIVPDPANDSPIGVDSYVIASTLQPGGVLVVVAPEGIGGSSLSQPMNFTAGFSDQGCTIYLWG